MLCVDDTLGRVEMRGEYIMDESGCGGLLIEFAEVFHCLLNTQIRSLHEWEWKRGHTISEQVYSCAHANHRIDLHKCTIHFIYI